MFLLEHITENAIGSMDLFLENVDNSDCDEQYEKWVDEFVNSEQPWWEFYECDLTTHHLNILLEISVQYVEETLSAMPTDVRTLLVYYGLWQVKYGEPDHFREKWDDAWAEKFPDNNQA
jgi:hypothetical protein